MSIYEVPQHRNVMKTQHIQTAPKPQEVAYRWIEANPWRAVSLSLVLGGWFGYRLGVRS